MSGGTTVGSVKVELDGDASKWEVAIQKSVKGLGNVEQAVNRTNKKLDENNAMTAKLLSTAEKSVGVEALSARMARLNSVLSAMSGTGSLAAQALANVGAGFAQGGLAGAAIAAATEGINLIGQAMKKAEEDARRLDQSWSDLIAPARAIRDTASASLADLQRSISVESQKTGGGISDMVTERQLKAMDAGLKATQERVKVEEHLAQLQRTMATVYDAEVRPQQEHMLGTLRARLPLLEQAQNAAMKEFELAPKLGAELERQQRAAEARAKAEQESLAIVEKRVQLEARQLLARQSVEADLGTPETPLEQYERSRIGQNLDRGGFGAPMPGGGDLMMSTGESMQAFRKATVDMTSAVEEGRWRLVELVAPSEKLGLAFVMAGNRIKDSAMSIAQAAASGQGGAAAGSAVGGALGSAIGMGTGIDPTGMASGAIGALIGGVLGNLLDSLVESLGILTPLMDSLAIVIEALTPVLIPLRVTLAAVGQLIEMAVVPPLDILSRFLGSIIMVVNRLVQALVPLIGVVVDFFTRIFIVGPILDIFTVGIQNAAGWLIALVDGSRSLYNAYVEASNAFTNAMRKVFGKEYGTMLERIDGPLPDERGAGREKSDAIRKANEEAEKNREALDRNTAALLRSQNLPTGYRVEQRAFAAQTPRLEQHYHFGSNLDAAQLRRLMSYARDGLMGDLSRNGIRGRRN